MVNSCVDSEGKKPSDQSPMCLPVHRIHKFDLVVEQGCFAGDHGSPVIHGLANIAIMLSKRGGGYQNPGGEKGACLPQLRAFKLKSRRFSCLTIPSASLWPPCAALSGQGRMAQAS